MTPARYRKKPVVIEAMRFSGGAENATPIIDWVLSGGGTARYHAATDPRPVHGRADWEQASPEHMEIDTLEGMHRASVGDYVIKGVKGEFYPCKPDIFDATYEQA